MKRGKDEKMVEPMFPRLHVSETDKGGPRAPPRNKMALYEQLSIPSQRFGHTFLPLNPNSTSANSVSHSSQGSGNERGMLSSHQQLPPRLISDKQYSQFSDLSTQLTQNDQRKQLDDDDFRVPIFIYSRSSQERGNNMDREKFSHFNPPYFSHSLKFSKAREKGAAGHIPRQEPKNKNENNLKEFVVARNESVKTITKSSIVKKTEDLQKQTGSSSSQEAEDNPTDCIDLLETGKAVHQELCAESQPASGDHSIGVLDEHVSAINNRNCSASVKPFSLENQNTVHDLITATESCRDGTFRSMQMGNLDRSESVSETSIVDAVSGLNIITPDDVVGILGQKHFWKARRAITNQQRVFAIQVFELHRLIKVQRGMALSPHLLEDATALSKQIEAVPSKSISLDYLDKALPYVPKQKGDLEKPSHEKESPVNKSVEKPSISAFQTDISHSIYKPFCANSPAQSISCTHSHQPWGFNQPQGHQWLIPVMSPSEGLVYKPFTVPGSGGPVYGGCGPPVPNPMMGNFVPPAYGIPPPSPPPPQPQPPPPQYQLPSFPLAVPHGYFPPYSSTPIISTAFSGSSVEQTNPQAMPGQNSGGENNLSIQHPNMSPMPRQNRVAVPDMNLRASEDIEVQASSASSQSERPLGISSEGRNVLPLFPVSPNIDSIPICIPYLPQPEHLPRVIKVVPHNSRSASESAARIFRSIQEERKQYDSM